MTDLLIAIAVFFATHLIPAFKPLRGRLVAVMGEKVYLVAFSLLSISVIVWLGFAFANAPFVEVWEFAMWQRWVPLLVMPFACVLLVGALSEPNPLSVLPRETGFDPERPGLVGVTRHPLIWGLVAWSLAHMVPNGDVAGLLMFGLLALLGVIGPKSLDHKRRAALGDETWERLARHAPNLPFTGGRPGWPGWRTWAGGLVLYGLALFGHPWVIGVSPFPW